MRLSFVVLGLALALPASAQALPWSDPAPLDYGSGRPLKGAPSLTANAKGLAVAYSQVGGSGAIAPGTDVSVFTNGVFLDPYRLSPENRPYDAIRPYGATRLLASGVQYARSSSQAVFAFGRLTPNRAALEAPRPLGPATMHAGPTALAVNPAGDAAMVYPVCRDAACDKVLVYLAVRRAGSSTIASTRLAEGDGPLPRVAAAINERGDALAVWTQAGRMYARLRTAGGTLRTRRSVGTSRQGSQIAPSASLSKHDGELVGWVSQGVGEGDSTPGVTTVAQARSGKTAFFSVAVARLPANHPVTGAGVRVSFDPRGRRLLAWTGFDGTHFTVDAGELTGAANSSAALTDGQTVSDPAVDTQLDDAVMPGAELLALRTDTQVLAARRAPGAVAPFARELVAKTPGSSIHGAILSDRLILVWAAADGTGTYAEKVD